MRAHVPAWACRLGAGRPVGPDVRRACFRDGRPFQGAGFLEANSGLLLLAENYYRTTTNLITDSWREFLAVLVRPNP